MGKTEDNLKVAFAGESQARNKYTYYAEAAKKEGYHYIAKIFEETAENERKHAKDHFKLLNGISDTKANLMAAIEGEHYETVEMYPTFAKEAEEEGNKEAAILFKQIGKV
ncbi:MAG: rubrerythrin family protein, partial [Cyanobacteriota bacterium]